jgi:hypothetical protein
MKLIAADFTGYFNETEICLFSPYPRVTINLGKKSRGGGGGGVVKRPMYGWPKYYQV